VGNHFKFKIYIKSSRAADRCRKATFTCGAEFALSHTSNEIIFPISLRLCYYSAHPRALYEWKNEDLRVHDQLPKTPKESSQKIF
jgi:hypothetical protein